MVKDVLPEHVFHVCDGTSIKNLEELGARLKRMSPMAFSHHVNSKKNDFAVWVRDCVSDASLCDRLMSSQDQKEMCVYVGEAIAKIKAEAGQSKRLIRLKEVPKQRFEKRSYAKPAPMSIAISASPREPLRSSAIITPPKESPPLLPAPKPEPRVVAPVPKVSYQKPIPIPKDGPRAYYNLSEISAQIRKLKESINPAAPSYAMPAKPVPARQERKPTPVTIRQDPDPARESALEAKLAKLAMAAGKSDSARSEPIRSRWAPAPKPKEVPSRVAADIRVGVSPKRREDVTIPKQSKKRVMKKARPKQESQAVVHPAKDGSDEPVMKLPFQAYQFPDSPSYTVSSIAKEPAKDAHHHDDHSSCMRCGLAEFIVGLAIGVTLAFVLARAAFGF